MRKRNRIALAAAAIGACVLAVVALTSVSSGARGPLSSLLQRAGGALGQAEHALRARAAGPGREAELRWLEPYRRDAARLRAPDTMLVGAYDDGLPRTLAGIGRLDSLLGRPMAIVQIYTAWGDRPDQQFPDRLASAVREIGSIPLVTWEPWLTDFESGRHPHIPLRDRRDAHGLGDVARGTYDFYIDDWARAAARFGRPIMLRFGHEMNDPYRYPWGPQNNTKEEFIAAWRRVVERFRAAGASNVVWVWSPHVAHRYWELYYPGADVVDWVATGVLNFGPIASWAEWWPFADIFGRHYDALASFGKPIMIAEFGSLAVGGDRAAWYREAFSQMETRHPQVRSVVFFNVRSDQTVTYQKVNWSLEGDSVTVAAVRQALSRF